MIIILLIALFSRIIRIERQRCLYTKHIGKKLPPIRGMLFHEFKIPF